MNNPVALEQAQAAQHLLGKCADKPQREAPKVVALNELVKIHAQELGRYAQVAPKIERLGKVDQAVLVMRILHSTQLVIGSAHQNIFERLLTHSRSFCRILTSTKAC